MEGRRRQDPSGAAPREVWSHACASRQSGALGPSSGSKLQVVGVVQVHPGEQGPQRASQVSRTLQWAGQLWEQGPGARGWPQSRLNSSLHDYVWLVTCNEKICAVMPFYFILFSFILNICDIHTLLIILRICIFMLSW